ncbi:MAG: gliding motility-associated C-terminal domain-containing protein [Bacteroidetes bacterium]|nr:gliding motility-associated C-terminal domain-containing protein [Bacteroidota bacterium]
MKYFKASLALLLFASPAFSQVQASFTKSDTTICVGDCIVYQSTSTGKVNTYNWTFNGGIPATFVGEFPPQICYPVSGNYITRLDIVGDNSTSSVSVPTRVGVYPDSVRIKSEATIEMGGTVFLQAQGFGAGSMFNWPQSDIVTCIDCPDVFASPLITQYVNVEFFSSDYCPVTDSVLITVKFKDVIDVPNSFSPDGNGVNEKLFVKGPGIKKLDFRVYDRYGTQMFQTNDQNEGWDGTHKGELLNSATFLWTLEYTLIDDTSNKKSGSISLIK